jgi:hypothetical protein
MSEKRMKRLERERQAASFVEHNHKFLAHVFEGVAKDLGAELEGESKATRRAREAAEMAHRLDSLTDLSGISPLLEALDWFGYFLASLGFLALVDSIELQAKRRNERIEKLEDRLAKRGPTMIARRKSRLERRIARLKAKPVRSIG